MWYTIQNFHKYFFCQIFLVWDINFGHFNPKKGQKTEFLDPKIVTTDDKNAPKFQFRQFGASKSVLGGSP